MANTKASGEYYEYATVDTTPGASGYFTNAINPRKNSIGKLFFSIRGTGTITVVLQFKCIGDSDWQDYYNDGNDFSVGQREAIESYAGGVSWRAGVKNDAAYTSGSVTFGFDW